MNRTKLVTTAAAAVVLLGLSACTSDETDTAAETTTAADTTTTSQQESTDTAEESAQHSEADVMFAQAEDDGHPAVKAPGIIDVSPWRDDALHPQAWWEFADLRARMVAQLRACLQLLEDGEVSA